MFREMRRIKQQVSMEECVKVLKEEKRGVLSVIGDDGYPYGVPMDYIYVEEENCFYFHCAKEGHKLDAMKANDKVCFTVYNQGFIKEGCWEYNPTSVISFGRVKLINDMSVTETMVRALGYKYYPDKKDVEDEIKSSLQRVQLIALHVEHMTGKLVNEK